MIEPIRNFMNDHVRQRNFAVGAGVIFMCGALTIAGDHVEAQTIAASCESTILNPGQGICDEIPRALEQDKTLIPWGIGVTGLAFALAGVAEIAELRTRRQT
jgi:hypothetical protein